MFFTLSRVCVQRKIRNQRSRSRSDTKKCHRLCVLRSSSKFAQTDSNTEKQLIKKKTSEPPPPLRLFLAQFKFCFGHRISKIGFDYRKFNLKSINWKERKKNKQKVSSVKLKKKKYFFWGANLTNNTINNNGIQFWCFI